MYELANKVAMQWLKDSGFDEVVIKEHSQISSYYEKKSIDILNKPELDEAKEPREAVGDEED